MENRKCNHIVKDIDNHRKEYPECFIQSQTTEEEWQKELANIDFADSGYFKIINEDRINKVKQFIRQNFISRKEIREMIEKEWNDEPLTKAEMLDKLLELIK